MSITRRYPNIVVLADGRSLAGDVVKTVEVVNLDTGAVVTCDILEFTEYRLRVVAEGSTQPFTMTRRRAGRRFVAELGSMSLETKTVPMEEKLL